MDRKCLAHRQTNEMETCLECKREYYDTWGLCEDPDAPITIAVKGVITEMTLHVVVAYNSTEDYVQYRNVVAYVDKKLAEQFAIKMNQMTKDYKALRPKRSTYNWTKEVIDSCNAFYRDAAKLDKDFESDSVYEVSSIKAILPRS